MRTLWHEITAGLLLVKRNFFHIATIFVLIALTSTIIALSLGDVLAQGMNYMRGKQLRDQQATYFQLAYPGVEKHDLTAMKILRKEIKADRAFTYIEMQVHPTGEEQGFNAKPTYIIVLIGHRASLMVSEVPGIASSGKLDLTPRAYLGASFPHQSFAFTVGNYKLTATKRLPYAAAYFSPHGTGEKLDNYVLAVLPPDVLTHIDDQMIQVAEGNSIFFPHSKNASTQLNLYAYISAAQQNGVSLIPVDLATSQPTIFRQLLVRTSIYIIAAFALVFLVLMLFWAIGSSIVRSDIREFSIRHAFGAPLPLLMCRFAAFLAITLLLPAAIPVILTAQINWYYSVASSLVLVMSVVIYLSALLYANASLRKMLLL